MKDKKETKVSLSVFIIVIVIAIFIVVGICAVIIKSKEKDKNNSNVSSVNESNVTNETDNQVSDLKDYILLYDGIEISHNTGVQELTHMELTDKNKEKYETKYYNYEKGKELSETEGKMSDETYEGSFIVDNVGKIAVSEKYDCIPRTYTEIDEVPEKIKNMDKYTSIEVNEIDLDGDGKLEYLASWTKAKNASGIMLLDSEYNKINDIVSINESNDKDSYKYSLDAVEYFDIDNDGIMEILISIPRYEGSAISILKYNNGILDGEKDYIVSLDP